MTAERAHRILREHGATATVADAARLLDALVPLSRHALRTGECVRETPTPYTAAPADTVAVQTRATSPPPVP